MDSTKALAHRAGALYFVFMIVAIVREFLFPTFTVPGDAAATARNILAAESMYRLGILLSFSTLVIFIFLVALLYKLFREVDRGHAMLMVLLVVVGVSISLANMIHQFMPLVLLGGGDYLSVFTKPQLEALSLGFLRLHSSGATVAIAFWGLWLFPFGALVIKSRFFPRILGILLMVAGAAYLTFSVTAIGLPEYRQTLARVLMPLYFGEVPIILWLLIKGAKVPPRQPAASEVR
jgi:hypothetical protein